MHEILTDVQAVFMTAALVVGRRASFFVENVADVVVFVLMISLFLHYGHYFVVNIFVKLLGVKFDFDVIIVHWLYCTIN